MLRKIEVALVAVAVMFGGFLSAASAEGIADFVTACTANLATTVTSAAVAAAGMLVVIIAAKQVWKFLRSL